MNKRQKIRLGIVSAACAIALAIFIVLNSIAASYNNVLVTQFGKEGETVAVGYSDYGSMDEALNDFTAYICAHFYSTELEIGQPFR